MIAIGATEVGVTAVRNNLKLWTIIKLWIYHHSLMILVDYVSEWLVSYPLCNRLFNQTAEVDTVSILTVPSLELKCWLVVNLPEHVTCHVHMSRVTCCMSLVTCHMSPQLVFINTMFALKWLSGWTGTRDVQFWCDFIWWWLPWKRQIILITDDIS